jgi:serine/threonine protein kinase
MQRNNAANELTEKDYTIDTILLNNISIPRRLGEGTYAVTYLGKYENKTVAIKQSKLIGMYTLEMILESSKQEKYIYEKIEMHRKAQPNNQDHSFLLQCLGTHTKLSQLTLVLEYVPNGDLTQWRAKAEFTWDMRYLVIKQVAQALRFLHELTPPIVHGDIKPANILLDEKMQAKVCDFGYAKEIILKDGKQIKEDYIIGSLLYMDPELMKKADRETSLDPWALGLVLYELFEKKFAYRDFNLSDANMLIKVVTVEKKRNCIAIPDARSLAAKDEYEKACQVLQAVEVKYAKEISSTQKNKTESADISLTELQKAKNKVAELALKWKKMQNEAEKASLILSWCSLFRKDRPTARQLLEHALEQAPDVISPQLAARRNPAM